MKKPEDDINPALKAHLKAQLDNSLIDLDEAVLQKLATARQKAIQAAQQSHAKAGNEPIWHKPMWAMAASICLIVPIWYGINSTQNDQQGVQLVANNKMATESAASSSSQLPSMDSPLSAQSTNLSQLEIMTNLASLDEDELEILEDLEFALWLQQEQGLQNEGIKENILESQGFNEPRAQPQSAHG